MKTRQELFESGIKRLREAGMSDADATMRLLFEEAFGIRPVEYLLNPEQRMSAAEQERFETYMRCLLNWEPLAYILGTAWFMGLSFSVNPGVLIPRQDTECLVEWILQDLTESQEELADICTGSGCIVESLLHYSPRLKAVGTDISPQALEVAERNAQMLHVEDRLELYQGDLLEALPRGRVFDRIVSNPPYIDREAMEELPLNVRREPELALYGGEDGLDFYRRIALQATGYLKPEGKLYFEIGYDQGYTVPRILQDLGYRDIQVRKDLAGRDRMICCTYSRR